MKHEKHKHLNVKFSKKHLDLFIFFAWDIIIIIILINLAFVSLDALVHTLHQL